MNLILYLIQLNEMSSFSFEITNTGSKMGFIWVSDGKINSNLHLNYYL